MLGLGSLMVAFGSLDGDWKLSGLVFEFVEDEESIQMPIDCATLNGFLFSSFQKLLPPWWVCQLVTVLGGKNWPNMSLTIVPFRKRFCIKFANTHFVCDNASFYNSTSRMKIGIKWQNAGTPRWWQRTHIIDNLCPSVDHDISDDVIDPHLPTKDIDCQAHNPTSRHGRPPTLLGHFISYTECCCW